MASRRQRLGQSVEWFSNACLSLARPGPTDLNFLLDCCLVAWEDKETQLAEQLLDTLIRFCDELQGYFEDPLWLCYNLTLTGIVGTIRGSECDQVKGLRHLNRRMGLAELGRCSQSLVFDADLIPFIRTGLALQGFIDVRSSHSHDVSRLEAADMIHLAQGLVEGRHNDGLNSVHLNAWFLFLQEIFKDARLNDWKVVVPPLDLLITFLVTSEDELAKSVFKAIYSSLTFPDMVKTTRTLFASTVDLSRLRVVLGTAGYRMNDCWEAVDEAALEELKLLRKDFYASGEKVYFDSVLTTASYARMYMVVGVVKLYIRIVLQMWRNNPQYLLEQDEKEEAVKWLNGLDEQAVNVAPGQCLSLVMEQRRAAVVVKWALLLTVKPEEYKIGVPFF